MKIMNNDQPWMVNITNSDGFYKEYKNIKLANHILLKLCKETLKPLYDSNKGSRYVSWLKL